MTVMRCQHGDISVCEGLCPDWEDWVAADCVANATEAMDAAEQWLDIPQVGPYTALLCLSK